MPPEGTNGGSTEIIPAPLSSLSGVLAHDMVADVTPVRTSVSVSFSKSLRDVPDHDVVSPAELERTACARPMLAVVSGGIKYYAQVRLYYCMYFPSLQRPVCRLRQWRRRRNMQTMQTTGRNMQVRYPSLSPTLCATSMEKKNK